jgi:DNA ligase-associated metallophosphoesterase
VVAPFFNPVSVHRNILLDGRLALFHQRQRWLAVADLHFGYELSQRAQGNLFPLWGIQNIETRLDQLLDDYKPQHLVLLGDLVHDGAGAASFSDFIKHVRQRCELILISGNHDRQIKHRTSNIKYPILDSWQFGDFYFHHGNCATEAKDCIQIIGHHHPAGAVRDGAGLRLKLPAFIQQQNCWIMPAFSPWAAGTNWFGTNGESKIWLCSPQRVFRAD